MKLRHLPFAGVLALTACPGPGQMSPAKPTEVVPLQKKLPPAAELLDPKQINPKDGKVLVLSFDTGSQTFLGYQVDPSSCTVRRMFKIDPTKVGSVLVPSLDGAGQLDIVRPNPPPPPNGDDPLKFAANMGARIRPDLAGVCQQFEPEGAVVPGGK
jgi:hypothetical protein